MLVDQLAESESFIQFANENQTGRGIEYVSNLDGSNSNCKSTGQI